MVLETRTSVPAEPDHDSAGAFGFHRREIIVLLVVSGLVGAISLWQWWQRSEVRAARQWTVSDVYIDTLLLTSRAEHAPLKPTDAPRARAIVLIDVNTADARQLTRIPGIGPALAARILSSRSADGPFHSLDDLQRVRGIGPRTAARMAAWVRFSGAPSISSDSGGEVR